MQQSANKYTKFVECQKAQFVEAYPDYQKPSPEDRLKTTQRVSLCTNCWSIQHGSNNFLSSKRCQVCKSLKHLTLHNTAKQFSRHMVILLPATTNKIIRLLNHLYYQNQMTIHKLKNVPMHLRITNQNSKPKLISGTEKSFKSPYSTPVSTCKHKQIIYESKHRHELVIQNTKRLVCTVKVSTSIRYQRR